MRRVALNPKFIRVRRARTRNQAPCFPQFSAATYDARFFQGRDPFQFGGEGVIIAAMGAIRRRERATLFLPPPKRSERSVWVGLSFGRPRGMLMSEHGFLGGGEGTK